MAFFKKRKPDDQDQSRKAKGQSSKDFKQTDATHNSVADSDLNLSPDTFVYPGTGEARRKPTENIISESAEMDPDSFVYSASAAAQKSDFADTDNKRGHKRKRKVLPLPEAYDAVGSSLEERYIHNFEAEHKLLRRNIKRVAAVILAMFIALMSYMVYFQVTRADALRSASGNRRNAEARNKVLRGSIYDRNGKVLSQSVLSEDGSQTREYPGGQAFGNILGYVSTKYSVTGLEASMDDVLSKQPGVESIFTRDFISSLLNPEEGVTKKQEGNSLHLTLDTGLQRAAYKALDGRKGSVVAMDPRTGEILAMVSSPGFSADKLEEVMKRANSDEAYAAKAPLINRAINSVFAPGSTMKVVTLAAGLENLPDLENRLFEDNGFIEFADGSRINNFNNNVYGEINLQKAFTNSSNVVFGSLGIELTNDQLRRAAEELGFNAPISIQGMTARQSIFPNLADYEKGDKALTAIGQGAVAATPLQMAMVASAVANEGRLAHPVMVGSITDKNGAVVSSSGEPDLKLALTRDVAIQVRNMMIENVQSGGSSYKSLQTLDGAGKTGTAQFAVQDGTRVHAWFIGFAPQKNPEIAFAVIVEDLADVKENTGAQQAIPVARDILQYWQSR